MRLGDAMADEQNNKDRSLQLGMVGRMVKRGTRDVESRIKAQFDADLALLVELGFVVRCNGGYRLHPDYPHTGVEVRRVIDAMRGRGTMSEQEIVFATGLPVIKVRAILWKYSGKG
jgi:hypothetical protein